MDSFGCLPVNVEHVPHAVHTHAVHTRTRSGTSTLCNEFRPLALSDDETAGAVTRDTAQQMYAGAICQPSASWRSKLRHPSSPHTWKSESQPTPRVADVRQYTRRRADTVSTFSNGPSLWRPRAVRQSLPAFQFECGYACGRKHSAGGTLDEDTFRQQYGETVHHRTIDHAKTVGGI